MLAAVHGEHVFLRSARQQHSRDPAHEPRQRRLAAQVVRRSEFTRIRLHGPAAAGHDFELHVPALAPGSAGRRRKSDADGESDGHVPAGPCAVAHGPRGRPVRVCHGDGGGSEYVDGSFDIFSSQGQGRGVRRGAGEVFCSGIRSPDAAQRVCAVHEQRAGACVVRPALHSLQSDEKSGGNSNPNSRHHAHATNPGIVRRRRRRLGPGPQGRRVLLLPQRRETQRHRRVRESAHVGALPPASDIGPVWPGPYARVHSVPRSDQNDEGVHAVRHGGRTRVARGNGRKVLLSPNLPLGHCQRAGTRQTSSGNHGAVLQGC